MERVNRDSRKNQLAREYHFAAGAYFIKNFDHLCRVLEFSDGEVKRIVYDNRHSDNKELAYQALYYRWMQTRHWTTFGRLATVLASAGEYEAIYNLLDADYSNLPE